MVFSPACHLVRVSNALGFYIDKNMIVTACHNRNSDGSYTIKENNKTLTCHGILRNNYDNNIDFIVNDDIQIISDERLTESDFYEGKRFNREGVKYLMGRKFRYPSFKHINNIKAAIKVVLPLERNYLIAIIMSGKKNFFLTNRLKQIDYCLDNLGISDGSIEGFVYQNSTISDLDEIYRGNSVSYSEALFDELRLLSSSVFSDVVKDNSLINCAVDTLKSMYAVTELTFPRETSDNNTGSFVKNYHKFDNHINSALSSHYHSTVKNISSKIIQSYYSANNIFFDLNSEYLVTVSESNQNCIHLSGNVFQINAPSYPGFSGGPVLDIYSRTVGLVIGGRQSNLTSTLVPFGRNPQSLIRVF